jgi:hypothetical protein
MGSFWVLIALASGPLVACARNQGEFTMESAAEKSRTLKWEGQADRAITGYLFVKLDRIEKDKGGLFGIKNSPSLAESLPDPRKLHGKVIRGKGNDPAEVTLHAPGGELPELKADDRVALALIGENACVRVLKVPADLPDDELAAWVEREAGRR